MGDKRGTWRKRPRLTAFAGCASLVGGLVAAVAVPGSATAVQFASQDGA